MEVSETHRVLAPCLKNPGKTAEHPCFIHRAEK